MSTSVNTADWVNDVMGDAQHQLKEKCKDFIAYVIANDHSTDITDIDHTACPFFN
jgi:hypothetical protein